MTVEWAIQTAILLGIGALAWFMKNAMADIGNKISTVSKRVDDLEKELGDLKHDLPFIYTTREDFIRMMNNVDNKLDKIHDKMLGGGR
ncbi:hypothetical protein [Paenibacillus sp. NPDC057967]|uniref:hypothetical protein n=1 Tax=Paenibacillus sp. NPDC057967 TaxID=3346293 RepID=UPI0036D84980